MEKTKHTSGPWRYRELGSEGAMIYPDYGDIRERGKSICRIDMRDTLTNFANAHLIAAAPDLLKAIKEILADHEERMTLYPRLNGQENRVRVMELAKVVIAKAEGQD